MGSLKGYTLYVGEAVTFQPASRDDAILILQLALRCAQLGHLTYSWQIHMDWAMRLASELL